LDLRDPNLFKEKAIWGAINLHYLDPNFEKALLQLITSNKDKPTFIYCQNGVYSARVAKLLSDKGIKEIYIMSGGYQAWTDSGF